MTSSASPNRPQYAGVVHREGQPGAHCNVAPPGHVATSDRLPRGRNNDGPIYLLVMEIICRLIDTGQLRFFMAAIYLGGKEGLRNFKKWLGFRPYRVRYSMS
jgi:hypothetical protein